MKNSFKRTTAFLAALTIVIGMAPAKSSELFTKDTIIVAHAATDTWTQGNCTITLNSDGVLTVSGNGIMSYYNSRTGGPWAEYKDEISSVVIEEGVTNIGGYAFAYLSNLTSVSVSSTVESIGEDAFLNCEKLSSINLPNGLKSIGKGAFSSCTSLTELELPNSLTTIGYQAFYNTGLTSIVIPDSITSISETTFMNCKNLVSVTIPNSVKEINYSAFYYCSALTSIKLPDSLTTIENDLFRGCTSLASVEIPNSVKSIGKSAFSGCKELTDVFVKATEPPTIGTSAFSNSGVKKIYVPKKSVSDYVTAWSDYADLIDGVYKLADGKYVQTADKDGKHYVRFVFVKPVSETKGKSSVVFTAKYGEKTKTFKTDKYYTSISTSDDFYVPESEGSGLFVVTIAGVPKESESLLSCDIKFE